MASSLGRIFWGVFQLDSTIWKRDTLMHLIYSDPWLTSCHRTPPPKIFRLYPSATPTANESSAHAENNHYTAGDLLFIAAFWRVDYTAGNVSMRRDAYIPVAFRSLGWKVCRMYAQVNNT